MQYTPTLEGDRIVQEDLNKILEAVKGKNFESLVLYGAYGKGEGCIYEGKPRNDYDLLLVGGDRGVERAIERVKTAVVNEVWHIPSLSGVSCSQKWYEIKYGSKLLAGKPLDLPDWEAWEIPFADAVESINNRCISMILGKYEMMKENPNWRTAVEQTCKGLISIGDAILIRRGEFHPLYSVRALMLTGDEIGKIYKEAVSVKIFNRPDLNPDQIWQFWQNTKAIMRDFVLNNKLQVPNIEVLLAITERTTKEQIEEFLTKAGVDKRFLGKEVGGQ